MKCSVKIRNSLINIILLAMLPTCIMAQGITVPSGFGAWGGTIFAGSAFIYPQVYTEKPDMAACVGGGIGNPINNLGLQMIVNMYDVSEMDYYSFDFKMHRYLGKGVSFGLGVESMTIFGTGAGPTTWPSPFLAISQDLGQAEVAPFLKNIRYTIGAGMGRFSKMSPKDESEHDNKATYAFASLQYRVLSFMSLHAEWNGKNANAGISLNGKLKDFAFGVMLSAADLTPYSSDGIRFLGAVGVAYQFSTDSDEKEMQYDDYFSIEEQKKDTTPQSSIVSAPYDDSQIKSQLNEALRDKEHLIKQQGELVEDIDLLTTRIQRLEKKNNIERGKYIPNNMKSDNVEKITPEGEPTGEAIEQGFYIVVFTFREKKHAMQAIGRLNYIGITTTIAYNNSKAFYYLMTQSYPNLQDAARRCDEIRDLGYEDAWIHEY